MSTLQKIQRAVPDTEENANLAQADFSFGIIEMIPFPVAYINNKNCYEYVNKAYLDWREVNKEDVIGKKVEEFLEPSVYEFAKEHMLIALNGNPTKYEIELPYRTDQRYAEVIYTPEFDKKGNVKGYLAVTTDITERKKSEELNARLAAIVQSSDDAIIAKTLDGIITSWNHSAVKMFGFTEEEAIGKHISIIIPPERIDEETVIITSIRQGKKIDHFETERIAKNGTIRNLSITVSPIKDRKGKIIGASKIARDISIRKEAELQHRLYTERLQELNKYKDEFMVMASHELKTPLTVISANLQLLQMKMQADDNLLFLNKSINQVNKLSALISNLLDVSKIQSGKL